MADGGGFEQSRNGACTRLVAADRLEGSAVHSVGGGRMGIIQGLIIDRVSGQVAYAILSLDTPAASVLSRVPLPWHRLQFDAARGVHVVAVSDAVLRRAPRAEPGTKVNWTDTAWTLRIDSHYAADARYAMPPHGL